MDALKAEQVTGSKWRVLAIPFNGPSGDFSGKDFDGEFFDRATDIKPHWFKVRPVIFHHGQDITAKDEDYGEEELDTEPTDEGWWGTMWLNRSARYWAEVDRKLRAGKMFGSSGSIAHLVRKDHKTGHIEVWPHAEQTLTFTPANPFARIEPAKALAHFTTAGIALDESVKAVLADPDARPSDLRDDLPRPAQAATGGDDAATLRRAVALGRVLNLERRLNL